MIGKKNTILGFSFDRRPGTNDIYRKNSRSSNYCILK